MRDFRCVLYVGEGLCNRETADTEAGSGTEGGHHSTLDRRLQVGEAESILHQIPPRDRRTSNPHWRSVRPHLIFSNTPLTLHRDSSFSAMTFSLWHLISDPRAMSKLRAELAPLFNTTQPDGFAHVDLVHAEYFNAVIDETMRLHSPACVNGPKQTPPEGIVMSDTFIPGNVSVISSIWSFHRSEKYFVKPSEWLPERWTSQPELVLDKRAFHPFSFGKLRGLYVNSVA